jgi:hypothetical protein
MFELPGDRKDGVTRTREYIDRKNDDAASRASHDNWTHRWRLVVLFHAQQCERSGENSSPDYHRFAQIQSTGPRDRVRSFEPNVFGITPIARFRQPATSAQHCIAFAELHVGRCDDMASDIDAADQWVCAQDLAHAGARERVLEVDRRVRGLDDDLAGGEIVERDVLDARAMHAIVAVDAEGAEGGGHA